MEKNLYYRSKCMLIASQRYSLINFASFQIQVHLMVLFFWTPKPHLIRQLAQCIKKKEIMHVTLSRAIA